MPKYPLGQVRCFSPLYWAPALCWGDPCRPLKKGSPSAPNWIDKPKVNWDNRLSVAEVASTAIGECVHGTAGGLKSTTAAVAALLQLGKIIAIPVIHPKMPRIGILFAQKNGLARLLDGAFRQRIAIARDAFKIVIEAIKDVTAGRFECRNARGDAGVSGNWNVRGAMQQSQIRVITFQGHRPKVGHAAATRG